MKAVLLAGGLGFRLREETQLRPKPMVEVGGRPLIWHIMKIYSHYGIHDFILCLGYLGYVIKEYFHNYALHMSDVTVNVAKGTTEIHENYAEPWRITLVDTGEGTMTGGRIRRIRRYLEQDDAFCLTYGDGVANIDIGRLLEFHRAHGRLATVTAVRPPARFGAMQIEDGIVSSFQEKPLGESGWINGGFFVLSPKVIDYIDGDATTWEREPLERLAREGNLCAYRHDDFWHPMDVLRDKLHLEDLWARGVAPWKIW
jgi:glucose-1-phosphate cytidylyltransferase